ncbi:Hpt domain-containing protein [Vallitaleaceae bacterium 9-2]
MQYEAYVDYDLEELVSEFMKNRQKDLRDLEVAFELNDMEKIQFIGHALKGVGSGYGFEEITSIGMHIEHASKVSDTKQLKQLFEKFGDYLLNVKVIFVEKQ